MPARAERSDGNAVVVALGINWEERRRALAVEQHEEWLEGARHLEMEPLREQRKQKLALAA